MPGKRGRSSAEWSQSFANTISRACDLLPCDARSHHGFAQMSLAASRLRRLAALVPKAVKDAELSRETATLVQTGIVTMGRILDEIEGRSLAGEHPGFGRFDDVAFFELARSLPKQDVLALFRAVVTDPSKLDALSRLTHASLLQQYGIATLDIGRGTAIAFKIIAILILILVAIEYPPLIPFAIAAVKALADMDKAGEADEQPAGAGGAPPTPGAGGGTVPLPGGGTVSPGGQNTVIVLPDGTVIVVTPDGTRVVVKPDGTVTPPPGPSTPDMPSRPPATGGGGSQVLGTPRCGQAFNVRGDGFHSTERGAEAWAKYHARQASLHACPLDCPNAVLLDWTVVSNRRGSDGQWHCHGVAMYECR